MQNDSFWQRNARWIIPLAIVVGLLIAAFILASVIPGGGTIKMMASRLITSVLSLVGVVLSFLIMALGTALLSFLIRLGVQWLDKVAYTQRPWGEDGKFYLSRTWLFAIAVALTPFMALVEYVILLIGTKDFVFLTVATSIGLYPNVYEVVPFGFMVVTGVLSFFAFLPWERCYIEVPLPWNR